MEEKVFIIGIYKIYTMRKIRIKPVVEIKLTGIVGFIQRKVTPFGNGAKVDCPKEYLGETVYLVIVNNEHLIKIKEKRS